MKKLFITLLAALLITGCSAETEQQQVVSAETEPKEEQPTIQIQTTAVESTAPEAETPSEEPESIKETEPETAVESTATETEATKQTKPDTAEKSPEEIRAEYVASCQAILSTEIITNPESYIGKTVSVSGTVIKADNTWSLWTGKGFNAYIDNGGSIWYITYNGKESKQIKENDAITCYGECIGTELYSPKNEYDYTIPSVEVEYFDLIPAPETTITETNSPETEAETQNPDEIRKEYIDGCETVIYKEVERTPDAFNGKNIIVTGKVIQVSEGWLNSVTLRVDNNGETWYVEYKRKDGESRILEDDYITCYGECNGVKSYKSVLGATITIPAMKMEYFEAAENIAPTETVPQYTPTDPSDNLTMGQKNALKKAKSYLDFSAFSWQGLIDQLIYEQFSEEDAMYAANNCGADWHEQALKKAKSYLSFSSFSYTGLIKQLEFDKFSTELATYAADNCEADWNEQAVKKAKSYLDFMAYSRDGLIDQLEYEGFTHEQAVYGVEKNGY